MTMKVTILGCGGSTETPSFGEWGQCNPYNPLNRRTCSSILIEADRHSILVDMSWNTARQFQANGVRNVTAVLFTHPHADHLGDSRAIRTLSDISQRADKPIDVYTDAYTLAGARKRFNLPGTDLFPFMIPHEIDDKVPFRIGRLKVLPFYQTHGNIRSLGFRFNVGPTSVAYSTDLNKLDNAAIGLLRGVDVWIVDCAKAGPHWSHSHWKQTSKWISRVRPKRAYLVHMHRDLDYKKLRSHLPRNVLPGYDGLKIHFSKPPRQKSRQTLSQKFAKLIA